MYVVYACYVAMLDACIFNINYVTALESHGAGENLEKVGESRKEAKIARL